MADRPIIFSTPMVNALFAGRKTQTRRLARLGAPYASPARQFEPGDRLWVRERWALASVSPIVETIDKPWVVYDACDSRTDYGGPWRSPIHMRRADSRITLLVTDVRLQRLQDISRDDAIAEGLIRLKASGRYVVGEGEQYFGLADHDPITVYSWLWERLHGAGAWAENPLVAAISFTVHSVNIDALAPDAAQPREVAHA